MSVNTQRMDIIALFLKLKMESTEKNGDIQMLQEEQLCKKDDGRKCIAFFSNS